MQSVFMNSFCIGVVYARLSRALVCICFFVTFVFISCITNRQELDLSFSVKKRSFAK